MFRSRAGGAEDVKGPVQAGQVPARQISRVRWTGVKGAPADALPGGDDGGHPHQDAAHVTDQIGGIPPGALRHQQAPAGPGRGQQRPGVSRGRLQLNGSLHDKESGMSAACVPYHRRPVGLATRRNQAPRWPPAREQLLAVLNDHPQPRELPAEALPMTIAGRPGVVSELSGPGKREAGGPHRRLMTAVALHSRTTANCCRNRP